MSDLIQLTGLWKNEKDGKTFLSGKLGNARVLVFPNKHKTDPKHPDYQLYLAPVERRERNEQQEEKPQRQSPPPPKDDGAPF